MALYLAPVAGNAPGQSLGRHPALRPFTAPRAKAGAAGRVAVVLGLNHLASKPQPALWGLVPADFEARTGLALDDFADAIVQRPGFDLYVVSAHPSLEGVHPNPWAAVEVSHPGFRAVAGKLLDAAGLPSRLIDAAVPSSLFATGHLMVATQAFWQAYLEFVNGVLERGLAGVDPQLAQALTAPATQPGQMTVLELIVARLASLFLMAARRTPWKVCKLRLPAQEAALPPHFRTLRALKDAAVASPDNSLLECWLAYRNLFLLHTQGVDWVQARAAQLSPARLGRVVPPHPIEVVQLAPAVSATPGAPSPASGQ